MTAEATGPDLEFGAMQTVFTALQNLDEEARVRVLDYVSSRLGIAPVTRAVAKPHDACRSDEDEPALEQEQDAAPKFGSFAELFDAAQPKSTSDKALVAGYWLQVCQAADSFDGFSVNKELKHLGEGLSNVTSAIDTLKGQKPALALQLKKSGKSRQARKLYKITVAGIRAVEAMIGG
ncbi:hypothetical protein [Sinorhizobium alkalisoli]|uniref:Uncharacterized protein n=1 Tax=Sinorhizobium alkalisoli TaxID=1752398 RepID=A0A1E3VBA1_9HYPH|nr:hypothetical protein [Sinorhizobium alkalisoli]ODR90863.1 hypothetical protein A8M32_12580 [Sinorhizobium alkalisoli]